MSRIAKERSCAEYDCDQLPAVELLLEAYRENARKDAPGGAMWETISIEVPVA